MSDQEQKLLKMAGINQKPQLVYKEVGGRARNPDCLKRLRIIINLLKTADYKPTSDDYFFVLRY